MSPLLFLSEIYSLGQNSIKEDDQSKLPKLVTSGRSQAQLPKSANRGRSGAKLTKWATRGRFQAKLSKLAIRQGELPGQAVQICHQGALPGQVVQICHQGALLGNRAGQADWACQPRPMWRHLVSVRHLAAEFGTKGDDRS